MCVLVTFVCAWPRSRLLHHWQLPALNHAFTGLNTPPPTHTCKPHLHPLHKTCTGAASSLPCSTAARRPGRMLLHPRTSTHHTHNHTHATHTGAASSPHSSPAPRRPGRTRQWASTLHSSRWDHITPFAATLFLHCLHARRGTAWASRQRIVTNLPLPFTLCSPLTSTPSLARLS